MPEKDFSFERYDTLSQLLINKEIKTYAQLIPYLKKFTYLRRDEVEYAFGWVKSLYKKNEQTGDTVPAFPDVKFVIFA